MAGEAFDEGPAAVGMNDAAAMAKLTGLFKENSGPAPAAKPAAQSLDEDLADPPTQQAANDDPPVGDDPPAGDPDDPPAEGDPPANADDGKLDYEFEGEKYRLPKKLVEARMRQDDYSRKTAQLEEQRKIFAQQEKLSKTHLEIRQTVAPEINRLQNMAQQLAALSGQMPNPTVDPVGYLKLDKQAKDLTTAIESIKQSVIAKGTELLKQKQSAEAELLRAGQEQLAREVPGWSDNKVQAEIVRHALDAGYTIDELNNNFDPRLMRVIHDAMQFRKGKAVASPAALTQKRVAQAAPTVRPSGTVNKAGSQRSQITTLKDRAVRSGSPDDATAALTAMFKSAGRRR